MGDSRRAATTIRFNAFIGDLGEKLMFKGARLFDQKSASETVSQRRAHSIEPNLRLAHEHDHYEVFQSQTDLTAVS